MASLVKLDCSGCTLLTTLPNDMKALTILYCEGCTSLTTLPNDMKALTILHCDGCTSLTTLPNDIKALKSLSCNGCTLLTTLPNDMNALTILYCEGCVFLYISIPLRGILPKSRYYSWIGRNTRDWSQRSRNTVSIKRLLIQPFREFIQEHDQLRKVFVYGVLEILLGYWKPGVALLDKPIGTANN